jgi:MFS family permease
VNRAIVGGCAVGFATAWNISNIGAIASHMARSYGVGLAVIGLFTTALFLTHLLVQIPAGRICDRFGARRVGLLALVLIASFNAIALVAPEPALALLSRCLVGIGTGLAFMAGVAYVRESGGSSFAQGLFGGIGLASSGLALAIVSQLDGELGWRAPYWTAIAVSGAAFILLAISPRSPKRAGPERPQGVPAGILTDSRLYRLAALYAGSFGLSVVVANWVVELLHRNSGLDKSTAGVIGGLTLLLGIFTRPLGGWILRERPLNTRPAIGMSLVAGAVGAVLLAAAEPTAVAVVGAVLIGLAAGLPFAPAFTGASLVRPDAPTASVGLVNAAASLVAITLTPLVGLTFALPGDGRIGFIAIAALWLAALWLLPTSWQLGVRPGRQLEVGA